MSVKTTQVTQIYAEYSEEIDKDEIEQLNKDLAEMEIPLKVYYDPSEDGWTLRFIKEEIE